MANPNIINATSIYGKSAGLALGTSGSAIVSNPASSGKIIKINTLTVANIDGTNAADVTAYVNKAGVNYQLAWTVSVPADATLVLISKDTSIYLEENNTLYLYASATLDLQAFCSYEEIS
jgi:hypothetical protein